MTIYVVGNSIVQGDNIPPQMIGALKHAFSGVTVLPIDPNENFIPKPIDIIVDSVDGIDHVTFFDDIDAFVTTKSVSGHDYDLGFHLKLLMKLKKISTVRIVGVPRGGDVAKITSEVIHMVTRMSPGDYTKS